MLPATVQIHRTPDCRELILTDQSVGKTNVPRSSGNVQKSVSQRLRAESLFSIHNLITTFIAARLDIRSTIIPNNVTSIRPLPYTHSPGPFRAKHYQDNSDYSKTSQK
jgi:hypothetical protein